MTPADSELLRAFVERKADDAFTELVRRHVRVVYHVALRKVGHPHLAEDVAQAVFTALAAKAPSLLRHHALIGWLHTTTRFAASEVLRAEGRRRRYEREASTMDEVSERPGEAAEWERLRPVIDDALGELKPADREAILLRFFAELPFTEVGAALNISENTARMRVGRALDKLHSLLTRRGISSSSAALSVALGAHAGAATGPTTLAAKIAGVALASAKAAAVSSTSGALLMTVSKLQMTIAAVATFMLGAAFLEHRTMQRLQSLRELERAEIAARNGSIARLERELAAARREQSRLPGSLPTSTANPATPAAAEPLVDTQLAIIRDRYLQRRAVARSDPEYQRLQTELRQRHAAQNYTPFFARWKLSGDRAAEVQYLLAEHAQMLDDIEAAAETQRLSPSDPALEALKGKARDALAARLRELLGEEQYAEFARYQQSAALRSDITDTVAVAVHASPTPLSRQQAEALTDILDRHTKPERDGTKHPGDIDWDAVLAESGSILTSAQLAALRGLRDQAEWSNALAARLSPMVAAKSAGK